MNDYQEAPLKGASVHMGDHQVCDEAPSQHIVKDGNVELEGEAINTNIGLLLIWRIVRGD